MKKLFLFIFYLFILVSCNKDDNDDFWGSFSKNSSSYNVEAYALGFDVSTKYHAFFNIGDETNSNHLIYFYFSSESKLSSGNYTLVTSEGNLAPNQARVLFIIEDNSGGDYYEALDGGTLTINNNGRYIKFILKDTKLTKTLNENNGPSSITINANTYKSLN